MKRSLIEWLTVLAMAAAVIFFEHNRIPYNLDYDEVDFGRLALSLDGRAYTPYSPTATGHATLYFYVILLFLKLLGVTNLALRLPAALFGVVNGLVFYLIMRLILKNYALLLALVFVALRWHFSFARFAFEATFLLFLELMSVYFFLRFCQNRNGWTLILSAVFAGLAFHSYTPGRIFFIVPLLSLAGFLVKKQIKVKQFIVFLGVLLLIIWPLVSYLGIHPDPRLNQQLFFKNPKLSMQEKMKFLSDSVKSTALMFHLRGDFNGRHNYPGKPAVNPLLGFLFLTGLLLAIKNHKDINNRVFLSYFAIALVPTIFTYPHENPHMLRTFTVIPAIVYFVGLTVKLTVEFSVKYRKYVLAVFCYLLFVSALYELRTYFLYQRYVVVEAFELSGELKNLIETGYVRPSSRRL